MDNTCERFIYNISNYLIYIKNSKKKQCVNCKNDNDIEFIYGIGYICKNDHICYNIRINDTPCYYYKKFISIIKIYGYILDVFIIVFIVKTSNIHIYFILNIILIFIITFFLYILAK